MRRQRRRQAGFTLVELIISTCILAVLSSIALAQMRDYSRRTRMSEVLMAAGQCKGVVSEGYSLRDTAPSPGGWGCEGTTGATTYVGGLQTSSDGVIRIAITNIDPVMNGHHVFLVPARSDGETALTAPDDLGRGVRNWICGSDWLPLRNSLPANCRIDTTTFASQVYN